MSLLGASIAALFNDLAKVKLENQTKACRAEEKNEKFLAVLDLTRGLMRTGQENEAFAHLG